MYRFCKIPSRNMESKVKVSVSWEFVTDSSKGISETYKIEHRGKGHGTERALHNKL